MKTKTLKRTIRFTVTTVLTGLVVFVLIKNRKDMHEELAARQNFNEIVPVETATARLIDFKPDFIESGVFRSNSDVKVVSETQGRIMMLNFRLGDRVKAGQVLAMVENTVSKSRFKLAKENLVKAEKDLKRFRELAGGEAATEQQLEAAKLAWQEAQTNLADVQKQMENTTLKAPVPGTISERLVEDGSWLSTGMHVCTISDQSRMTFQVRLAGEELHGLSVGQLVNIKVDIHPLQTFTGKIKSMGVVADLSGRYLVEINVPNPGYQLRAGIIGKATFNLPVEKNRLVIPRKCIDGSLHQAHVFILDNNQVSRRSVTVELLNNELVAVISGLQPGERVVATGQINLADGTPVRVINN